ncbi:MAG: cell division protein ZapB [Candidatus Zixiibacteriota bacterium]|nr:MAG: cell division protein ZapB [candidate division Zixibacteria bacterium]
MRHTTGSGQYELGLLMDLTQFEDLERKIIGLIERQDQLRSENSELRTRINMLEEQLASAGEENQRLQIQCGELTGNQRDRDKEEMIRHKVVDLLQRLEGL